MDLLTIETNTKPVIDPTTMENENTQKTNLARILSVSGQSGLFRYIAQARNGFIVESLKDGKRTCIDNHSHISTMADISIYTYSEEMKLRDVFEALHKALGEEDAPTSKASSEQLKDLFRKAVPEYDESRFYVSHMKKVVDWYNALRNFASLDFEDEEAAQEAEPSAE